MSRKFSISVTILSGNVKIDNPDLDRLEKREDEIALESQSVVRLFLCY